MSGGRGARRGLTPLGRSTATQRGGVEPRMMGTGPIPATRRCLEKAGLDDRGSRPIEANEAFAAQAIAVNRELGWDADRST